MSDVPPQAPPAAPPAGLMPFDPDVEFEAELIRRYGHDGRDPRVGLANDVIAVANDHERRLGQHQQRLNAADRWADGVNAFGEFQMEMNGNTARHIGQLNDRAAHLEDEVGRIRTYIQGYNGWFSWAIDGACVAIIIGLTLFYLSSMNVALTIGNLGVAILADVVLIVIVLAITSHIRRLDDPPAPPAGDGNGAAQPQPDPVVRQANPVAATEQIPAVHVQQHPAPPPPPPAATPQANP